MRTYIKLFIICFIIFTTIGIILGKSKSNNSNNSNELTTEIASKILRFHVIANSDCTLDQQNKLCVKDAILEYLNPLLSEVSTLDDARLIINNNIKQLESVANKTLAEKGCNYRATAQITKQFFPVKVYGDMTLPAGNYEALCINIGASEGKNWWCVMYPTLCFVDCTYSILPEDSKSKLQTTLTTDEYNYIMNTDNADVKYSSKLLEWLF